MALRWVPIDCLEPHPENANRMLPGLLEKLKSHIRRTGRYEPLVVRPMGRAQAKAQCGGENDRPQSGRLERRAPSESRYQILNGHHRAEVLKALGHTRARCDVCGTSTTRRRGCSWRR